MRSGVTIQDSEPPFNQTEDDKSTLDSIRLYVGITLETNEFTTRGRTRKELAAQIGKLCKRMYDIYSMAKREETGLDK